jgi:hypothetical protein
MGFRVWEALLFDNECNVSITHITKASVLTLKILNPFVRLIVVFQLLWNVSCHSQAAMHKNQHLNKSALLLHNYIYIMPCEFLVGYSWHNGEVRPIHSSFGSKLLDGLCWYVALEIYTTKKKPHQLYVPYFTWSSNWATD